MAIGLGLQYGIKPVNPVPVDTWSGPYSHTDLQSAINLANDTILPTNRFQSMEVRLIVNNVSRKFWYRDGIANGNLVEFTSGSVGATGATGAPGTSVQSAIWSLTTTTITVPDTSENKITWTTDKLKVGDTGLTTSDNQNFINSTISYINIVIDGYVNVFEQSGISSKVKINIKDSNNYSVGSTTLILDGTYIGGLQILPFSANLLVLPGQGFSITLASDVVTTYSTGYLSISAISTGQRGATGSPGATGAGSTSSFYIKGTNNYSYDTTSDIYRTGAILIGTASIDTDDRFIVSSKSGTVSLVVDNNGSVYNSSRGITNSSFGYQALYSNTTGIDNIAFGFQSLKDNTTGSQNTAFGRNSIRWNTSGGFNTAFGAYTLQNNGTGISTFVLTNAGSGFTQSTTFSNVQLSYISGTTASIYPIVTILVGAGGIVSTISLVSTGTGFKDTTTVMGTNLGGTGTTFSISVLSLSTGGNNTAIGYGSLANNTIGQNNTSLGLQSLRDNTTGFSSTAVGRDSLRFNTTGNFNTAVGKDSLRANTSGTRNTSIGYQSLLLNTTGNDNSAIGYLTLNSNTTGTQNTAIGNESMKLNTIGYNNTAIGVDSLLSNISGNFNTAIGKSSLYNNVASDNNTAIGSEALYNNIAPNNTAIGSGALTGNTIGTDNTAIGSYALVNNTTQVLTLGTFSVGSGYTQGIYSNVQLTYLSGSTAINYPRVSITVTGNAVSSVTLLATFRGSGFKDTTTIMTASFGGGTGFTIRVASITSGIQNTAIGMSSLQNNQIGSFNTSIGYRSLFTNNGNQNTALGYQSLSLNTTGYENTAVGASALSLNTTGYQNTVVGASALSLNTIGYQNTAIGVYSLLSNTIGGRNTAIGNNALYYNLDGNDNTAIGHKSINLNQTGYQNTAIGVNSLLSNISGSFNTTIGYNSLSNNSSGAQNIAIGLNAGNLINSGAINTESDDSIFIGSNTSPGVVSTTNEIVIGFGATGNGSNTITLGNNFITGTYLKGKVVIADGTQGVGKVLTSDANGVSSWATAVGGGSGGTSSFYLKNTSNYSYNTTSDIYRTGALTIGSNGLFDTGGDIARFAVESTGYTASLIVSESGNVYNASKGINNTVFGYDAGKLMTQSIGGNVAFGSSALYNNIAEENSALGVSSLLNNKTGTKNTAVGFFSLVFNTIGSNNIAIGNEAGTYDTTQFPGSGVGATNSSTSVFIGVRTAPKLDGQSNQIVIGYGATGNGSNTVTLGNNSIANTYLKGAVQTNGTMTATGFFNSSDARLKDIIERDGDTIKFTWKDKRDDKIHIGYIAQEVQEKYPNQVNENTDGLLVVNYIEVLVAKIQELENRIKILEK